MSLIVTRATETAGSCSAIGCVRSPQGPWPGSYTRACPAAESATADLRWLASLAPQGDGEGETRERNRGASMIAFARAQLSPEDPIDEDHVTENDGEHHQRAHQHEDMGRGRCRGLPNGQ